jgi:hypothetical protein
MLLYAQDGRRLRVKLNGECTAATGAGAVAGLEWQGSLSTSLYGCCANVCLQIGRLLACEQCSPGTIASSVNLSAFATCCVFRCLPVALQRVIHRNMPVVSKRGTGPTCKMRFAGGFGRSLCEAHAVLGPGVLGRLQSVHCVRLGRKEGHAGRPSVSLTSPSWAWQCNRHTHATACLTASTYFNTGARVWQNGWYDIGHDATRPTCEHQPQCCNAPTPLQGKTDTSSSPSWGQKK